MTEGIKKHKTHLYAIYKRLTSDLRHIQTESEQVEKRYFMRMETESKKASKWGSNTYIRQNRLWNKDCNKRKALINDKGINPTREHYLSMI